MKRTCPSWSFSAALGEQDDVVMEAAPMAIPAAPAPTLWKNSRLFDFMVCFPF